MSFLRPVTLQATLCAAAGAIALATAPASALTFAKQTFVCPIDGKKFTARIAASGTSFGMRLDTKRLGPIAAPGPMPVCPGSRFPVYKRNFTEAEKVKLRKLAATAAFKEIRANNTDYFVAAYVQEQMGAKPYRLAHYYLRASWQAEKGDAARHRRYLGMVVKYFDAHVKAKGLKTRTDLTAALLAANALRRLGKFDEARARLKAAGPAMAALKRPVYRKVAAQIDGWAEKRNADPQKFQARPVKPKK